MVVLDATHSVVDRLIDTAGAPDSPPGTATGRQERQGGRPDAGWTTARDAGWDVALASLRKLLPVPDGAWLEWSEDSPLAAGMARVVAQLSARRPVDERATALGVELGRAVAAMRASSGSRWERSRLDVCEIAARHEEAVGSALTPSPASARTVAMLMSLRLDDLRHRAEAARRLRERLAGAVGARGLRVVNPGSAGCVALGAAGRDGDVAPTRPRAPRVLADVEEALAGAGMWGPVSWPDPLAGPDAPPWPIVVTAPTDEPERVDELVGVVGAALGGC